MANKITELDFLNIVERHSCNGKEVNKGKAKEGHENCGVCHGNYFVSGECNFGGFHTIQKDLKIINQNLDRFDLLLERQSEITRAVSEKDFNKMKSKLISDYQFLIRKCEDDKLDFFTGTCIMVDGKQAAFLQRVKEYLRLLVAKIKRYIEEIENLDWWKLKNYKDRLEKLEKMTKEANQLAADYKAAKERGDEDEANRLLGLLLAKKNEISSLEAELKKDPLDIIFGEETKDFFANIAKNIFQNNTNFLNFRKEDEGKKEEEGNIFGFIPKKHISKLKWGAIILGIVLLLWLIIRWGIKKIN